MKIGLVCSAGGSAGMSALDLLFEKELATSSDVLLITDRSCDAEPEAEKRGIRSARINYRDPTSFSSVAREQFVEFECDLVFLMYSRRVSEELYLGIPTLNIHPSLLPLFPGIGAVKQAYHAGARFLGATLHSVTEEIDSGPILAQVASPVRVGSAEADFARISFIQKTYLMICMVDLYQHGFVEVDPDILQCRWTRQPPFSPSANPCFVTRSLIESFSDFQSGLGFEAITS